MQRRDTISMRTTTDTNRRKCANRTQDLHTEYVLLINNNINTSHAESWQCDGEPDCIGSEDEADCPTIAPIPNAPELLRPVMNRNCSLEDEIQ